ncbi:hypothetical protein [Mariprofundus ferrooxydans]|nr:hypothetical protein [Mariprofundus ferrooxydans]
MKKLMMIAAGSALRVYGTLVPLASPGVFSVDSRKRLPMLLDKHKVVRDWRRCWQRHYAQRLKPAQRFLRMGFKVERRANLAAADAKWKKRAGMMTGQFKSI